MREFLVFASHFVRLCFPIRQRECVCDVSKQQAWTGTFSSSLAKYIF